MPKEHRYIITEYSLNKSILGKSDFIDFQYLSNHWHYGIDTNYNLKKILQEEIEIRLQLKYVFIGHGQRKKIGKNSITH